MTIPLSVISDWFCGEKLLFAHYFGAICMTAGFITINLKKRKEVEKSTGNDDKNDGDSGLDGPTIDNTVIDTRRLYCTKRVVLRHIQICESLWLVAYEQLQ